QSATLAGARDAFDLVRTPSEPRAPAKPRRAAIMIIGAILSTVLAVGLALLAEMMDGTVRGRRDLHDLLGVAPLAVVPEIRNSSVHGLHFRRAATTAVAFLIATPLMYLVVRSMVN